VDIVIQNSCALHKMTQHLMTLTRAPLSVTRAPTTTTTTSKSTRMHHRRRSTPIVAASSASSSSNVVFKSLTAAALSTTTVVFPALADAVDATSWSSATEGSTSNPALLGFTCVAVCWGIPQTLGTAILAEKEKKGRALLEEAGVDASDIPNGNWGKIQRLLQDNGIDYRKK
jgi:hypothetical protein